MAIQVQHVERYHKGKADLHCPVFVCDVCGKQIIGNGNYEYKVKVIGFEISKEVYLTHKKCSHVLRYLIPINDDELWYWDELKLLPTRLYTNFSSGLSAIENDENGIEPIVNMVIQPFGYIFCQFGDVDTMTYPGIYFLYDGNQLDYIGQSQNSIRYRLKSNHHVYQSYHKVRAIEARDDDNRNALERVLITMLRPNKNITYNKDIAL